MALTSGLRLGPYEIVSPLGAGGMGEVYRARDSRLNRDVAIKILPDHLSKSPELRERFEREARAISQLSHPHICVLHDIGEHDAKTYLVLECLEGETLGDRLHRGPLPADQVLKYGAQIGDALDKAHRRGVVHRDLKPDNIMLTKSGVKVLDFGLAKPLASPAAASSSIAATMTHGPLTAEGMLVGTFQYMAPEQLEGKEADARSDIFALGCVLYEMCTGKRAFDGKSTASVVAAIMGTEPPALSATAPLTPPALEWAIRKCLSKDPEERWQSAGDLASELRWISEGGSRAGVAAPARGWSRGRILRRVAVVIALLAAAVLGYFLKPGQLQPLMRVALNLPSGTSLVPASSAVLSPDGKLVVMNLSDSQGRAKFWIRSLASKGAQPLEGTEGGALPFWSPDSRFIAFFAIDGKLRKIPAGGGPSEAICDIPWAIYGGSWGSTGVIVVSTGRRGLVQVPASGGSLTRIPVSDKDPADYLFRPSFLPDGKHFLGTAANGSGIYVVSLDNGAVQLVVPNQSSPATYAAPGYLLYLRGDNLVAQAFDSKKLRTTGAAQNVAESVFDADISFSATDSGSLLYQRHFQSQLTWLDDNGTKISTVGSPGLISIPFISPDGKRAMVPAEDARLGKAKLWLYDLVQGTASPFTFGDSNDNYPAWSPDGKKVAYASNRTGQEDIYIKSVSGESSEEALLTTPGDKEPDRWSSDGRYLLFDLFAKDTNPEVWALPLSGDRKPFQVTQGPGAHDWGTFSPDNKWIAYASDESGREEVYVVPFPGQGGRWRISSDGGVTPFWPTPRELFYTTPDFRVMSTELQIEGSNLAIGKSRQLFGGRAFGSSVGGTPSPDGKRWLMALPVDEPNVSPLILTTNWTAALAH